jgi:hypothetical protein
LVGSTNFHGRRVALFNASPRATAAQEALRLVLTTMAVEIVEGACITIDLLSRKLDAEGSPPTPICRGPSAKPWVDCCNRRRLGVTRSNAAAWPLPLYPK